MLHSAVNSTGKMAERSKACDSSESLPAPAGFSSGYPGVGSNPTLVNIFIFLVPTNDTLNRFRKHSTKKSTGDGEYVMHYLVANFPQFIGHSIDIWRNKAKYPTENRDESIVISEMLRLSPKTTSAACTTPSIYGNQKKDRYCPKSHPSLRSDIQYGR